MIPFCGDKYRCKKLKVKSRRGINLRFFDKKLSVKQYTIYINVLICTGILTKDSHFRGAGDVIHKDFVKTSYLFHTIT